MKQKDIELKNFLSNIKWLRSHYGLTKYEMAKILRLSVKSIERIERGEMPSKLSLNVVFRIQSFFNITAKEQFEALLEKSNR